MSRPKKKRRAGRSATPIKPPPTAAEAAMVLGNAALISAPVEAAPQNPVIGVK